MAKMMLFALFPYSGRETHLSVEPSGQLPLFTYKTDIATEKASRAALGKAARHRLFPGPRAAGEEPPGPDVTASGAPPRAGSPAGDSPLQGAVPHPPRQRRAPRRIARSHSPLRRPGAIPGALPQPPRDKGLHRLPGPRAPRPAGTASPGPGRAPPRAGAGSGCESWRCRSKMCKM